MENITEALKMAGAVLLFVVALSVGMYVIQQSKTASDAVLYATDKYEFIDYTNELGTDSEIRAAQKRKVGIETIIPTLYKYATEKYTIIFKDGSGAKHNYNPTTGEFDGAEPEYMPLYYTTNANYEISWASDAYVNTYLAGKNTINNIAYTKGASEMTAICIFDENDEAKRRELFRGSQAERKKFLDVLIYGGRYLNPTYNTLGLATYDPTEKTFIEGMKQNHQSTTNLNLEVEDKNAFIKKYATSIFLEEIGEYNYALENIEEGTDEEHEDNYEVETNANSTSTRNTKRIITYTLIKK